MTSQAIDNNIPTLRIGIAGLGTVGQGVITILRSNAAMIAARCGKSIEIAEYQGVPRPRPGESVESAGQCCVNVGFDSTALLWYIYHDNACKRFSFADWCKSNV